MSASASSLTIAIPDLIGHVGVTLIVATYFLVQIGRMDATRPLYPAVNGVGAALILCSLYYNPNWPSVVMEAFWLLISMIGVIRALRSRKATR